MSAGPLKTVTSIDGVIVPPQKAVISVFDNALLYAEGLFETLLAIDDRLIFLDLHMKRLFKGAKVTDLTIPASERKLIQWLRQTAAAHPSRIKKVRLTITSGDSARWTGVKGKPHVIISASPHDMPDRPFRLVVSPYRVDESSEYRQIKTLSYVISAVSIRKAQERGFDDALLLNERGQIAEVTSANIFWVRDDVVYTPPLSAGCLEGTTRKVVIDDLRKLGYRVVEKTDKPTALSKVSEVFISSSTKFVVDVSEIVVGRRVYRFTENGVTTRLFAKFSRRAGL